MWRRVAATGHGGFGSLLRSPVSALGLLGVPALFVAGPAAAQVQQLSQDPQTLRQVTVDTPAPRPPRPRRALVRRTTPAQPAQAIPAAPMAQPTSGDVPAPKAASEATFTGADIAARPATRPAEALEVTPGLIVTQHSGEGKANQYFLRGYNLDHGTDLAITVDGVPVNMRTHGHGQGYADLNFLIPELIGTVNVRKGLYYADEGDFSSVGALAVNLIDRLEKQVTQVTVGSFGYRRFLGMGSTPLGAGALLYAGEVAGYNGPWTSPDDMRKLNGILRYSQGTADNGLSLTGMGYSNRWNATDQVPLRAVTSGEIGLYGAIDPSDGGNASRYSLSGRWTQTDDTGAWRVNVYAVKSTLNLFNNFTYFLSDQTQGDQFHQSDDRLLMGANAARTFKWMAGGLPMETTFGVQSRYDDIRVGLTNTMQRQFLSNTRTDLVKEGNIGIYAQNIMHWTPWLRTIAGWRGDLYQASDISLFSPANSGNRGASISSPKFSLVLGPFERTEFYVSAGYGFHSNDVRGVTLTEDPTDPTTKLQASPFLVRTKGAEVGVRTKIIPGLDSSISLFRLDQASELVFLGDAGTTEASRPSRRVGVEFTNKYRPLSWLGVDADIAVTRARFVGFDQDQLDLFDSLTGFPQARIGNAPGNFIPGAPKTVASAGITLGEKTGWFGALRYRYLGPRPLTEDNAFRSPATGLVNGQLGYRFENGWRLQLDVLNLLDSKSDQISYAYGSFLPSDNLFSLCFPAMGISAVPAAVCRNGVMDRVLHPVEPLAVRLTLAGAF
jgi:TonB dependent receptor/TonB-dependent Receptor Plug Domain